MKAAGLRLPFCMVLLLALLAAGSLFAGDDEAWFNENVLPVLRNRCFECHSHAGKIKGGLVLDSRSGWQQGGDHGPALVPGHPDDSLIVKAVRYEDHDLQMPPNKRLAADELKALEQWVQRGAPDPRAKVEVAKKKGVDFDEALKHWAFQPVKSVPGGLQPLLQVRGGEVDRCTLLRRASLDLTGLPPMPEDIATFLADTSADAFAHVVDRLLASTAYGERWARHWLDLVGYADQIGTANDVAAREAWRYRDYVVKSFNADKPFDRFIQEQVAGDLMHSTNVPERQDQIIATGFLVLGNVNIVDDDKARLRVDLVDQQVEKVGKAFLGMTLNCTRCHDHKFDPITLKDYYGMAGIFMSTESVYHTGRGVWSAPCLTELPQSETDKTRLGLALGGHEEAVASIKARTAGMRKQSGDLAARLAGISEKSAREPVEKQKADCDKEVRDLDNRLRHLDYLRPAPAIVHATHDSAAPADMHITIRGNAHALGPVVPRGFVQAVFTGAPPVIPATQSGRLQLAEWLTSPGNKLAARVTVNRIWQKLFGQGIVPSVDYFGLRGDKPSNAALLDALAARFVHLGWSQKRLIREIMLSPAYRQVAVEAGAPAPAQHRFRLDAEAVRDAVLAISSSLLRSSGGPALALEYPENVSGLDPKSVNPAAFSVSKFRPEQAAVRTLYLPVLRSSVQKGPGEILDIFDFAQPAQIQGQRAVTTVPPQALYLMNGPLIKNEAGRLADLLWKLPASSEITRLADLYLRVFDRPATVEEISEATAFIASFDTPANGDEAQRRHLAWSLLCQAFLTSNEFLFRL